MSDKLESLHRRDFSFGASMEYEVKVKGTEDVERLGRSIDSLENVLKSARGSGKSLEELRKIITGFKGQAGVFHELRDSMKAIPSAAAAIEKSMQGVGTSISRTLKSEFELTRATLRTEIMTLLKGIGSPLAAKIEGEVGGAMVQGIERSGARAKSAAAKVRAEMTKQYEALVSGDGFKQLSKDELGEVALLKGVGATISPFHAAMLKNEVASIKSQRKVLDAFAEVEASKVKLAQTSAEKQLQVDRMFAQAQAAHAAKLEATARKRVEEERAAKEKQLQVERTFNNAIAAENAKRLKEEENHQRELARIKATFAKAKEDQRTEQIRKSVSSATNTADAPYQKYAASTGTAGIVVMPKVDFDTGKVRTGAEDLKRFTVNANDAHSAVRGLASGFNLLWLTWGNIGPLMAGASLSFAVKKSFDIGSEVEYNIKMMEMLGQTTQEQGPIVRQALRDIDQTTQFSLLELSKSMVQLGQAGLTTQSALETLRPAADLASLGMVDLKTSTDLLIQTTALFGKTSRDSGDIAAKIFEATKSGVLNVEDISGSMKYASETNTRFGKSLEETLALLNALAQAGIKASSGGTAYINFLRDLNGRSGPAIKAMKDLSKASGETITAFNADGSQKTAIEMFTQIYDATQKLKAADADKILSKIFSDRGGRTFYAMVREGNVDLQKTVDTLRNVDTNKFYESARGLMDTSKGALDVLKGAMVGALDQTFERYSTGFKTVITDITTVLNSSGFQASLDGLVGGVVGLYGALKTLAPVLTTVGVAYATFKAAALGVSIFQTAAIGVAGMTAGLARLGATYTSAGAAAATSGAIFGMNGRTLVAQAASAQAAAVGQSTLQVAIAGTTAATAASTGVLRGFAAVAGFLANPIVGAVAALGLLGYTFYSTQKSATENSKTLTERVLADGKINMNQWSKEIALLRERAAVMNMGRYSETQGVLDAANKDVDTARKRMQISQKGASDSRGGSFEALSEAAVQRDTKAYMEALARRDKIKGDLDKAIAEDDAKEQARLKKEAEKAAAALKAALGGDGTVPPDGGGGRFGGGRGPSAAQTYYDTDFELFKKRSEAQKALNETYYQQGRLSAEQYYDFLEVRAQEAYQAERAALEAKLSALKGDKGSTKEYQKTAVDLEVLDINRTAELAKLEHDRTKAVQERLTASQKMQAFANDYLSSLEGDGSEIAAIKYGSEQAQIETARTKIHKDFAKQRIDLEKAFIQESKGLSLQATLEKVGEYNQQLAQLQSYEDQALQIKARGIEAERLERLKASNGITRAVNSYVSAAADMASQAESLTTSALKSIEDGFVSLATKGKLSFTDMANSIIADMTRIASKQLASGLSGILGEGLNSLIGGVLGGGTSGFSTGQGVMDSLTSMGVFAKGAAFSGSPSLSQYSNTVQSSPKLFAFANGGVFGEAGPEAVMPLTRGADGNLGVRQFGGGGGGNNIVVNLEVVQNGMEKTTNRTEQSTDDQGNILIRLIQNTVSDDIAGGGKISRSIKQRFSLKG